MAENVTDGFTLASSSVEQRETSDEEIDVISKADKEDIKNAFVVYIGKENYKSIFEVYINRLNFLTVSELRSIAMSILEKINDIYGYEFFINNLSKKECFYVFDLIAFLEFKYINFFAQIWKELNIDILQINIPSYCFDNLEHIKNVIDSLIPVNPFSKFITDFLENISAEELIDFFVKKSIEKKTDIKVEILIKTQGENDEENYN